MNQPRLRRGALSIHYSPGSTHRRGSLSYNLDVISAVVLFIHKHWLLISLRWTTRLGQEPPFRCFITPFKGLTGLTGAISGLDGTCAHSKGSVLSSNPLFKKELGTYVTLFSKNVNQHTSYTKNKYQCIICIGNRQTHMHSVPHQLCL